MKHFLVAFVMISLGLFSYVAALEDGPKSRSGSLDRTDVVINLSIERGVVLNSDNRIRPRPTLPSVVLKYDPHEVVLFPVVEKEMREALSLRRDERDDWIELD